MYVCYISSVALLYLLGPVDAILVPVYSLLYPLGVLTMSSIVTMVGAIVHIYYTGHAMSPENT